MLKLLIVDDEEITREGILERLPWAEMHIGLIEQADDGVNAFKKTQTFEPDIVLTDVKMPRMNGIEMSIKLKEIFPQCRIIFMSGYSDKEYLKSAIKLGAVNYIEKPINPAELQAAIKTAAVACLEEKRKKQAELETSLRLHTSIRSLRSELALQLIYKIADTSHIHEKISAAALDISTDSIFVTVLVSIFDADNISLEQMNTLCEALNSLLESRCSQNQLRYFTGSKEGGYIIIHLFGNASNKHLFTQEKLFDLCRSISDSLKENVKFFISVGKRVQSKENIYQSFEAAVLMMQKAFFRGYDSIISYQDSSDPAYYFSSKLVINFSSMIEQEQQDHAIFVLKKLTHDVKQHEGTLITNVRRFYYTLYMELDRLAKQNGFDIIDDIDESHPWESFAKLNVLEDLENFLASKVHIYFKKLNNKLERLGVINKIMKYIQSQYHNDSLSINSVSEHTHMAPTYICSLFKEKTGKTINQYITEFRIEKAKELLQNQNLKISDIGLMIGYSDSNYFTRLFKKSMGVTPSEYRERF